MRKDFFSFLLRGGGVKTFRQTFSDTIFAKTFAASNNLAILTIIFANLL